jgi:hypothetical protein
LRRAVGCTFRTGQVRGCIFHSFSNIHLDRSGVCFANLDYIYCFTDPKYIDSQPYPDPYFNGDNYQHTVNYPDPYDKHNTDTQQYTLPATAYFYQHAYPLTNLYHSAYSYIYPFTHYGAFIDSSSYYYNWGARTNTMTITKHEFDIID